MTVPHDSSPADSSAHSEPRDESDIPSAAPSLLDDLTVLITEIEAAAAGDTALDARIHFGFRVATRRSPDIAALMIETGVTWPTVEAVMDEQIPPFSTSLDAALEGEDIMFVIRSAKRRRWGAMQKARCGEEVLAWAATEPLARRLAAIAAWRVDLEKSAAAPQPVAETSRKRDAAGEEVASDSEWEVMF